MFSTYLSCGQHTNTTINYRQKTTMKKTYDSYNKSNKENIDLPSFSEPYYFRMWTIPSK